MAYNNYKDKIILGPEGGVVEISYELTCASETTIKVPDWIEDVVTGGTTPTGDGGYTGTFTLTISEYDQGHPESYIYFKIGDGDYCEDKALAIIQNGISCSCTNIQNVVFHKIGKGGGDAGYELGIYTITGDCVSDSQTKLTAVEVNGAFEMVCVYDSEGGHIKVKDGSSILPNESEGDKNFYIQMKYNGEDCGEVINVKQEGNIPCSCESIEYFVNVGTKATFPAVGTNNQMYIVGSGDTAIYEDPDTKQIIANVCGELYGHCTSTNGVLMNIPDDYVTPEGYTRLYYENPGDTDPNRIVTEVKDLTLEEIAEFYHTTVEELTPEQKIEGAKNRHIFYFKAGVNDAGGDDRILTAPIDFYFKKKDGSTMDECSGSFIYVERNPNGCDCSYIPRVQLISLAEEYGIKIPCDGTEPYWNSTTGLPNHNVLLAMVNGDSWDYRNKKFSAAISDGSLIEDFETVPLKRSGRDYGEDYTYYELRIYGKVPVNPDPTQDRSLGTMTVSFYCSEDSEIAFDVLCTTQEIEIIQSKCEQCNCDTVISKIPGWMDDGSGNYGYDWKINWCEDLYSTSISNDLFKKDCVVWKLGYLDVGGTPVFYNDTYEYTHIVDSQTVTETLTGYNGGWYFAYITRQDEWKSYERVWADLYFINLLLIDGEGHKNHRDPSGFLVLMGYKDPETGDFVYCDNAQFTVDDTKCDCEDFHNILISKKSDNTDYFPYNEETHRREKLIEMTGSSCSSIDEGLAWDVLYQCNYEYCMKFFIKDGDTKHSGINDLYYGDKLKAYVYEDTNNKYWRINVEANDRCTSFQNETFEVGGYYLDGNRNPVYCTDEFLTVVVNKEACNCEECNCSDFKSNDNIRRGSDIEEWDNSSDEIVAKYYHNSLPTSSVEINFADIYRKCRWAKITSVTTTTESDTSYVTSYSSGVIGGNYGEYAKISVAPFVGSTQETPRLTDRITIITLTMCDNYGNVVHVDDEGKINPDATGVCTRTIKLIENWKLTCDDIGCGSYYYFSVDMDPNASKETQADVDKYFISKNADGVVSNLFSIPVDPEFVGEGGTKFRCFSVDLQVDQTSDIQVIPDTSQSDEKIYYSVKSLQALTPGKDYNIDINVYKDNTVCSEYHTTIYLIVENQSN